jgi:hypothetical protein
MHRSLYLRTKAAAKRANMRWYEWIAGAAYAQLKKEGQGDE